MRDQQTLRSNDAHSVPLVGGMLQRKCGCGNHTVAGGECAECGKKKNGLQRMLAVGASNDPFEQEANRIADQVLAGPTQHSVHGASLRIQPYARQETASADTAPASVDRVLANSGQPLDASLRQDMEQRFGHDFSLVRVHSGETAEQSARELNARAYTVGHDIVFGPGRFEPGRDEGRRLIAHELTHVVQQTGPGNAPTTIQRAPNKPGDRSRRGSMLSYREAVNLTDCIRIMGEKNVAYCRSEVLGEEQPMLPGWKGVAGLNKEIKTVDEKGQMQSGILTTTGVWRVPIEGLTQGLQKGTKGPAIESSEKKAVALIPNTVKAPAPATPDANIPIDVLLHFHGFGIGYRELRTGEKDYAGVLQPGEVRDVALYQMEQQLLSHVRSTNRLLIAILVQGSETSDFGNLSTKSDDYLKEVFGKLVPMFLPANSIPGRLILSGHSGGGPTAMAIANQRLKTGARTDVLLFDAINFGCAEKELVFKPDGTPDMDASGNQKKKCKEGSKCASNEATTVRDWITNRINAEVKSLSGADANQDATDLQKNGTRFRGVTSGSLKTSDTCSYGFWYNNVKTHIETTIKNLKVAEPVRKQLGENYKVEEAAGLTGLKGESHERVMSRGNLEAALKP